MEGGGGGRALGVELCSASCCACRGTREGAGKEKEKGEKEEGGKEEQGRKEGRGRAASAGFAATVARVRRDARA
jgi:hypothetical protein